MFEKMKLFFQLFQKGKEVTHKEFWKQQQGVVLPVVVSLLMACVELARAYGVSIPLDQNSCYMLAGAAYFIVNFCLTYVTSKHIGIGNAAGGSTASLPAQSGGTAQSSVPEPAKSSGHATEPVQNTSETNLTPSIDEDVLARARAWVERNSKERDPFANGD